MRNKPEKSISYGPEWTPDGTRERLRWVENASTGLRIVGAVDEITSESIYRPLVNHQGWYLSPFGNDCMGVARGYVLQLPARDREPQYVPAISDPWNDDCYICDFHSVTEDLHSAIYAADSMAENYAEREREDQTIESAKLRAEELRDEASTLRAQHRALVTEMRAARASEIHSLPTICQRLHDDLRALRANVRKALKRAAQLDAEPYSILE